MQRAQGFQEKIELPRLDFPNALKGLLKDKVGIITGASRGIGAATAFAFAGAGARVAIAARDSKALESVANSINSTTQGVALAVPTDVTDPPSVERLVRKTFDVYGKLDMAFNNAGDGHMPTPLADLSVEDFDRAMNTNSRGIFLSMKFEIPAMLKNGGGSIVNMSSTAGLQGVKGISGYVAGKHAIIGLSRAAAMDYAQEKIRVNVVAPGPIYTERLANVQYREQAAFAVPLGRVGNREEVASVVAWLCSDLATYVTGAVVPIDGGRTSGSWFSAPK
jgi:NAD(P)-dependent dehydrogenase (short-subunit alcohol dehydrogenase family)